MASPLGALSWCRHPPDPTVAGHSFPPASPLVRPHTHSFGRHPHSFDRFLDLPSTDSLCPRPVLNPNTCSPQCSLQMRHYGREFTPRPHRGPALRPLCAVGDTPITHALSHTLACANEHLAAHFPAFANTHTLTPTVAKTRMHTRSATPCPPVPVALSRSSSSPHALLPPHPENAR